MRDPEKLNDAFRMVCVPVILLRSSAVSYWLGAKATRTWQSNVDCLASKRSVIRTGAFGRFAQLLDEFFERFETLADSFLRFWRRAFEPAA